MKIYDISQEVSGFNVYIDNPEREEISKKGRSISDFSLDSFIGIAYLIEHKGLVTSDDAITIIGKAREADRRSVKRILIKGKVTITIEAKKVFAEAGTILLGYESHMVEVSYTLVKYYNLFEVEIVVLEGIKLDEVSEGVYFMNAAPINLYNAQVSPCRATLIELV